MTLLERRLDPQEDGGALRRGAPSTWRSPIAGIAALEEVGVMESVRAALIPMAGRMLHDEEGRLQLIPYGNKPHEVIYSVSRAGLNALLLDAAESTGRVSIRFGREVSTVDFKKRRGALPGRRGSRAANASDALRSPHRDGWKRLGGYAILEQTGRTARRGAARPRL